MAWKKGGAGAVLRSEMDILGVGVWDGIVERERCWRIVV